MKKFPAALIIPSQVSFDSRWNFLLASKFHNLTKNIFSLFERMVPTVFHGAPAVYRAIGETITNQVRSLTPSAFAD